jgi:valyl-tRNA synthetase
MLIAPQGQDILFDEKRCEVGRNFMNKLWNAARFIQMQRSQHGSAGASPSKHSAHDLKILFEMNDAIAKVGAALDGYKFNEAARELYDFVWGDFCNWYIEASKVAPNIPVLDEVFGTILRLLHPYAPFITEELWNGMGYAEVVGRLPSGGVRATAASGDAAYNTIQFTPWPAPRPVPGATAEHAARVDEMYELVGAGRQLRNDYGIEPKKKLRYSIKPTADDEFFQAETASLKMFLNAEEVVIDRNFAPTGVTPSLVTKAATIFMVGAVDVGAERQRLTKQLADIEKQLAATEAKLANESFVSRAATIAVERERDRQRTLREQREKVAQLLQAL